MILRGDRKRGTACGALFFCGAGVLEPRIIGIGNKAVWTKKTEYLGELGEYNV